MVQQSALAPLFDVSGRRIPPPGLTAAVNPASDRYALAQPAIDYSVIHRRISEHLKGAPGLTASEFQDRAEALLASARQSAAELVMGTHVPFVLAKARHDDMGRALEETYLPGVGASYKAVYPNYEFRNELKALAGKMTAAAGSRYERLVDAMATGPVVGIYFPLALSGFSVNAAIEQMPDLPEGVLLSGGYDVCAALIGSPELIMKIDGYAPQLDLSAIQGAAAGYGYHFAPYGYNLTFNGRYHNGLASDYCTSGLTWISQKS